MPAPTFINPLLETDLNKYANRTDELLYELLYNIQNGGLGGGATPPAGANTQIQYNNAGAFGAANAYWDNVNDRLGIGVTPITKLHVLGNGIIGSVGNISAIFEATNPEIQIKDTVTTRSFFATMAGNYLYMGRTNAGLTTFSNYAGVIRLDQGSWSIGSGSNPNAKLHVYSGGTTSATTALLLQNLSSLQLFKVGDDASVTIGGGSRTGYLEINGTAGLQLRARDLSNGFYADYTNNSIGFFGDATRTFEIRTGTGSYDTIARWSDLGDFNLYNTSYTPLFTALSYCLL